MTPGPVAPGTVFQGRYEILAVLGEGGFSVIYKGRQLATGQQVAIKVMRPARDMSPAGARRRGARFQREMRFCARLHHPNIVRLIDSGEAEEGRLYTVFELVPGKNLAEVLAAEGALEPGEARYLMLQILDALSCAHGQGVVHRDLKPDNIMVVPTGARRNALVLDFGIGTTLQGAAGAEASLTRSDEVLCTPTYAAPEQIRGLPPTARSDLYAWGLVFLECLTGRPVFTGGSLEHVIFRQASSAPIPIPAALVGHPLGAILRRATIKDVTKRAATAEGLLRELEACDVSGLRREELAEPAALVDAEALEESPWEAVEERWRPAAPSAVVSTADPAEGERRLLTVVCCALTAAGPSLASIDVEEMDELFGGGQEICAQVAQRFQGRVAVGLGNQVLLHFGDPAAREDDALRAARAAQAVAADVGAWSARLLAERGIAFELRIGIHTGIIVTREGHASVQHLGWTTQVAARLSGLAAPGTIAASRDVYRILCGWFDFEKTTTELPGGGAVYRLKEEEVTSACQRLEKMPLFGREQEIDLLIQRWGQARQGTGQVVLVTGEAGIGKTHLTVELARRLQGEAHTCLKGRCMPDRRPSPLHPIVEAFDRLLDADGDDAPGSRLERLEALLTRCGFPLAETAPLLAALLSIPFEARDPAPAAPAQRQKERTFQVMLSLLFELAEEQPILLLIENLHWADPTTLEWLGSLVREAPSARVMALFTARPELSLPWPTSGMLQIQLGRLDRACVEQIAEQVADGRALPEVVIEQIVGRADGVPLFAEELSRMVIESGALRQEGSRYVLAEAASSTLAIPTTLQGLLRARLDRLGRARGTAQLAAALGREFRQDVLGAVSPLDEAELQEDLDKLVAADLVHRRHRVRGATWVFKHALVRDAAYESLPKRAQRRVHARIAAALEERFPEIVRARPEVLVLHHAAAEQKRQALFYTERAAEIALQRPTGADAAGAEELLEQALGWLAAIEDERERTLTELRLSNLLVRAMVDHRGTGADLTAVVHRGQTLIDRLGDTPLATPILLAAFLDLQRRGQHRESWAVAEQLVALAQRLQDTDQLICASLLLGMCLFIRGRLEEARRSFESVLSLYAPDAHRVQAVVYGVDARVYGQSTLAVLLCCLGELDRARAEVQAANARARELDHPMTLGMVLHCWTWIHYLCGEREKAAEVVGTLSALAERHGLWIASEYGEILRYWVERDVQGMFEAIDAFARGGSRRSLASYRSLAAEIQAERGQHEAAIETLDGCLRLATEIEEMFYVPEMYRLKALSLQALGEHRAAESEECLRRAIALAREQGARMPELRSTLALCRLLAKQGRRDEARVLLREVCAWPAEQITMPELAEARGLLGELTGS